MDPNLIPLEEICHHFGWNLRTAKRKDAAGEFPISVIRLNNSRKAPRYVKRDELHQYITKLGKPK